MGLGRAGREHRGSAQCEGWARELERQGRAAAVCWPGEGATAGWVLCGSASGAQGAVAVADDVREWEHDGGSDEEDDELLLKRGVYWNDSDH